MFWGDEVDLFGGSFGAAVELPAGQIGLLNHVFDAFHVEVFVVHIYGHQAFDAFDSASIVGMASTGAMEDEPPGEENSNDFGGGKKRVLFRHRPEPYPQNALGRSGSCRVRR